MKSSVVWVIIIILIAGGWYFWQSNQSASPDEHMEEDGTMMEDGSMMEDGDAMMEEGVKTFDLTGKKFEFSMKEIRVKKGDTVKINFASTEGFHDWKIDEFNAQTQRVQEGDTSSVEFVADKAGTFEYYCSVGSHRQLGMVGKLIVE